MHLGVGLHLRVALTLTAQLIFCETGATGLKSLPPCRPVILRTAPHINGTSGQDSFGFSSIRLGNAHTERKRGLRTTAPVSLSA